MKKITNQFLIALPNMVDPIFKKSIIYMCEYNKDGHMGLIINKPIANNNAEIFTKINTTCTNRLSDIYFGGPVNLNQGIVLHDNNYSIDGTSKISNNISLTSNEKIMNDIDEDIGPSNYKFIIGYSGWSAGQLEKEIENGDWLVTSLDEKAIFDFSEEKKWTTIFSKLGLDVNLFTGGKSGVS